MTNHPNTREPTLLLELLVEAWEVSDSHFVNGALSVLSAEAKARSTFKMVRVPPFSTELDRRVIGRAAATGADLDPGKTKRKTRADTEYEDIIATDVNTWDPTKQTQTQGQNQKQEVSDMVKRAFGNVTSRLATKDEVEELCSYLEAVQAERDLTPVITMTDGQSLAWDKLVAFLNSGDPFFALKGFAGTGKSFLMKKLSELHSFNLYFSAPTNKATKVLSDFIGEQCKTTYSLLGLRMVEDEDRQVLSQSPRLPQLGHSPIIVIDEAGMIPRFMAELLMDLAETKGWRVIFVGDPAQLNPVKESRSIVWSFAPKHWRALLTEVKRFDNQLLALSIEIRTRLKNKTYGDSPIVNDNDGEQGVFVLGRRAMMNEIKTLSLDDWKTTKVGVWRNKTAAQYTAWIRKNLGFKGEYDIGDLILMASPVTDSEKRVVAFTDEEFQIKAIEERSFELEEATIEARVLILVDSKLVLNVPKNPDSLAEILNRRAGRATRAESHERKMLWARYWNLRNQFHQIRHGYCLTAHRLQGSTLKNIFVDQSDVLANPNEREAYRALYVLATRPTNRLTTF